MSYGFLVDYRDYKICPYDDCHVIRKDRFHRHLWKCHQNHPELPEQHVARIPVNTEMDEVILIENDDVEEVEQADCEVVKENKDDDDCWDDYIEPKPGAINRVEYFRHNWSGRHFLNPDRLAGYKPSQKRKMREYLANGENPFKDFISEAEPPRKVLKPLPLPLEEPEAARISKNSGTNSSDINAADSVLKIFSEISLVSDEDDVVRKNELLRALLNDTEDSNSNDANSLAGNCGESVASIDDNEVESPDLDLRIELLNLENHSEITTTSLDDSSTCVQTVPTTPTEIAQVVNDPASNTKDDQVVKDPASYGEDDLYNLLDYDWYPKDRLESVLSSHLKPLPPETDSEDELNHDKSVDSICEEETKPMVQYCNNSVLKWLKLPPPAKSAEKEIEVIDLVSSSDEDEEDVTVNISEKQELVAINFGRGSSSYRESSGSVIKESKIRRVANEFEEKNYALEVKEEDLTSIIQKMEMLKLESCDKSTLEMMKLMKDLKLEAVKVGLPQDLLKKMEELMLDPSEITHVVQKFQSLKIEICKLINK